MYNAHHKLLKVGQPSKKSWRNNKPNSTPFYYCLTEILSLFISAFVCPLLESGSPGTRYFLLCCRLLALAFVLIRGTPSPRQLADDPLITYVTLVDNVLQQLSLYCISPTVDSHLAQMHWIKRYHKELDRKNVASIVVPP
jgi:hypothetical protein